MKKLMIAAAIVCAAAYAQAANYSWTASASTYMADDGLGFAGDELEGFAVYAFDANAYSMSQFAADVASSASLATSLGNALTMTDGDSNLVDGQAFVFTGAEIGDDGAETPYINAYLAVVSDDEKYYHLYAIDPIKVTDPVKGSGATLDIGDTMVPGVPGDASGYWTQVAPEPTSGLLLLIGVAGLALRRRRA